MAQARVEAFLNFKAHISGGQTPREPSHQVEMSVASCEVKKNAKYTERLWTSRNTWRKKRGKPLTSQTPAFQKPGVPRAARACFKYQYLIHWVLTCPQVANSA